MRIIKCGNERLGCLMIFGHKRAKEDLLATSKWVHLRENCTDSFSFYRQTDTHTPPTFWVAFLCLFQYLGVGSTDHLPPPKSTFYWVWQALQGDCGQLANPPGAYKDTCSLISTNKLSQPTAKGTEFIHLAWKDNLIRMNQNWRDLNDCYK